ncbi:MAG: DotI/IcmL family type IV secretion protein [Pseudomonadota bacterium]
MFQFWIERFLLRFSFLFAFVAFIGVFYYAYHIEVNAPPPEIEVAPFKETAQPVTSNAIVQIDVDAPLSKPHVTSNEIQNWLNTSVSEALTFAGRDYQDVLRAVRPYFTASGFSQYRSYLEQNNIKTQVGSGQFRIGIYFDQRPYVSNGVSFQDIYRWRAQMPLSISFQSRSSGNMTSQKINLNLQVRRVEKTINKNGVQIDSWEAALAR